VIQRVILLCISLLIGSAANAESFHYSSAQYGYTLTVPAGWVRIPEEHMARHRAAQPPAFQHLIADLGLQRGGGRNWFTPPYVMIQVIPNTRTGLRKLPTEAQFEAVVRTLAQGRWVERANLASTQISESERRRTLEKGIAALTASRIEFDVPTRRLWFTYTTHDPFGTIMNVLAIGEFLSNGRAVQVNAFLPNAQDHPARVEVILMALSIKVAN